MNTVRVQCLPNFDNMSMSLASSMIWRVILHGYSYKESAAFRASSPQIYTRVAGVRMRHVAFAQTVHAYCYEDRYPLENIEKTINLLH